MSSANYFNNIDAELFQRLFAEAKPETQALVVAKCAKNEEQAKAAAATQRKKKAKRVERRDWKMTGSSVFLRSAAAKVEEAADVFQGAGRWELELCDAPAAEEKPFVIHPNQQADGLRFVEMMKPETKDGANGETNGEANGEAKGEVKDEAKGWGADNVKLAVFTANKLKLITQTRERTTQCAAFAEENGLPLSMWQDGQGLEGVMAFGRGDNDRLQRLLADARAAAVPDAEDKSLFFVVMDESHWAAGADQTGGETIANLAALAFELSNVRLLLVSATPYVNFRDLGLLEGHCRTLEAPPGYKSLQVLADTEDPKWFTATVEQLESHWTDLAAPQKLTDNAVSGMKVASTVALNYVSAIAKHTALHHGWAPAVLPAWVAEFSEPIVHHAVGRMLNEDKLIVVRFPEQVWADWFIGAIEHICAGCHIRNLPVAMSSSSKPLDVDAFLYTAGIQVARPVGDTLAPAAEEPSTFDKLEGARGLLVIVDQGSIGDSFPSNTVLFDLRTRWSNDVSSFATLRQACGRACGFGDRPYLLTTLHAQQAALDSTLAKSLDGNLKPLKQRDEENEENQEDEEGQDACIETLRRVRAQYETVGEDGIDNYYLMAAEMQSGKTGTYLATALGLAAAVAGLDPVFPPVPATGDEDDDEEDDDEEDDDEEDETPLPKRAKISQ